MYSPAVPGPKRTALVTGSNRGIGLEVCRQLAAKGLRVIVTARTLEKAEAAVRLLGEEDVLAAELDITNERSVANAKEDVTARAGTVDVLVNNAGINSYEDSDVLEIPLATYRSIFETNLFGAISVCRAFVPEMTRRRYGRVVNVSSRAGQISTMSTYAPAYSMSKVALNAFTRQLAAATHGSGVLVNSACPGWVRTAMGGRSAPRSVEQGADTIVWLATLPDGGPSGGFFGERTRVEW